MLEWAATICIKTCIAMVTWFSQGGPCGGVQISITLFLGPAVFLGEI